MTIEEWIEAIKPSVTRDIREKLRTEFGDEPSAFGDIPDDIFTAAVAPVLKRSMEDLSGQKLELPDGTRISLRRFGFYRLVKP